MPLQLTGRHMTLTEEQKDYIEKKVNRLRRMFPKIDELSFTVSKEKLSYDTEAKFRAGRIAVQATVSAAQPLESIDILVDKLEAQITKAKKKLAEKKPGARAKLNEEIEEDSTEDEDDEESDGDEEAI